MALGTLPDGTQAAVLLVGYSGPIADGEKLLRPLREFGPPLADQVGPAPYTALQGISEHFNPRGYRNYLKTNYLRDLSDDAIDILVERYVSVPAPFSHIVVEHMGGAVSRMDRQCHGVQLPGRAVQLPHCRHVARSGGGRTRHPVGPWPLARPPAVLLGEHLRQL